MKFNFKQMFEMYYFGLKDFVEQGIPQFSIIYKNCNKRELCKNVKASAERINL